MNKYQILNTFVNQVTEKDLNKKIINYINNNEKIIIGNLNINAANLSYENTSLKLFNDSASIVFCDGSGIQLACYILGYKPIPQKITYNTWFPRLLSECAKQDKKVFVLGSSQQVNKKAIQILKNKNPNLQIAGHHGFFEKNGKSNQEVIELINEYKPDILTIGFGMPLQEEWIMNNYKKIDSNIFLNGGAFLEWISGSQYQAPQFISNIGMEWLWRLIQSPRKLFKRYMIGNFLFFYRILIK